MVVMGHVLAPFGVRGWIKIRPFTHSADSLVGYASWWLKPARSSDWRQVARLEARVHGETVLAQLEGIATREDALALRGAEIAVPRSALPAIDESEIYRADLLGLQVVNR